MICRGLDKNQVSNLHHILAVVPDLVEPREGADEGVRVCARDGDAKELAGEHVAGAVAASNVRVLGRRNASIRPLN